MEGSEPVSSPQQPGGAPTDWLPAALVGVGVATIVTDARGLVRLMNPVAETLTGWPQGEAAGRPVAAVFRIEDEQTRRAATDPVAEVLATGAAVGLTDHTVLIARDGTEWRLDHGAAPVRDAAGDAAGAVLVFCDVSARQRAMRATETALRAAHAGLEMRVRERTAELDLANGALTAEIARREAAEADRRDLLQRLATAQEDERRRIARELHDQLGQHLTALGLGLKVVKDTIPDPSPARDELHKLQLLTGQIGREVHQLALQLRPVVLDDLGLRAALANCVEEWAEQAGAEADFHAVGFDGDRLPPPVETALYRVTQEALTNVLRHASARRVSVVLQRSAGQVLVVVEDDGRGFDPESAAPDAPRLGVIGMRERLALVGGSLAVESGTGRGTTLTAQVPLPAAAKEGRDG